MMHGPKNIKHERNVIKLHVQLFLRMKTWLVETCRRQYN
jgi:hypothetical protein